MTGIKTDKEMNDRTKVPLPEGKLGILIPGMGAVATTLIAGVEAARMKIAEPIGSLTQMGRISSGDRQEVKNPLFREYLPLANLEDIEFGGWDVHGKNVYEVALKSSVIDGSTLEQM